MLNYQRVNPIQIDLPKPASRPQSCPRKVWMVLGPATNWTSLRRPLRPGASHGKNGETGDFFDHFWRFSNIPLDNFDIGNSKFPWWIFFHNSVMKVDCLLSYYLIVIWNWIIITKYLWNSLNFYKAGHGLFFGKLQCCSAFSWRRIWRRLFRRQLEPLGNIRTFPLWSSPIWYHIHLLDERDSYRHFSRPVIIYLIPSTCLGPFFMGAEKG